MSSKLVDNKRRHHVDKVLREISKPHSSAKPVSEENNSKEENDTSSVKESAFMSSRKALADQYDVIRSDLVKLKVDVFKGMDIAKEMVGRRNIMELFRSRT